MTPKCSLEATRGTHSHKHTLGMLVNSVEKPGNRGIGDTLGVLTENIWRKDTLEE